MKAGTIKTLLILFVMIAVLQVAGQNSSEYPFRRVYAGFGLGPMIDGNHWGINTAFTFPNNWGVSFNYNHNMIRAKATPDDYVPPLCILWDCLPTDHLHVFAVRAMREYPTSIPTISYGFEAGPLFGMYKEAWFTRNPNQGGWFFLGSNYITRWHESFTLGVSLRAKANWDVFRFAGLEVAVRADLSPPQSYAGLDFYINLGYLRKSTKMKDAENPP
jgi:hypothetical protein